MKFNFLAGLACAAILTAPLAAQAGAKDYFWPDHQPKITYKAKSYSFRGTLTFEAGNDVTISGKTWRELTARAKRLELKHEVEYQRADEGGLYTRVSTAADAPETQILMLPAKVGASWDTVDEAGEPSKRTIEKLGNCEIRGKAFEQCITVGYESEGMPAIAVFAPGYGEVLNSQVNGFVHRELTTK